MSLNSQKITHKRMSLKYTHLIRFNGTPAGHTGLLARYNAEGAQQELKNSLLAEADKNLSLVTDGTGIELKPEDLLDPRRRLEFATAIQRKSSAKVGEDSLDSQAISFAIQSLAHTAIINNQLAYDPKIDDICVFSALSSSIVRGASEGGDSKVLISDILHELLQEAGDHDLETVLNQVKTLRRSGQSGELLHGALSEDILAFLANKFLKYEHHEIPDVRSHRKYEYTQYKIIGGLSIPEIGGGIANKDANGIGRIIRDSVLLSSVIANGELPGKNLSVENLSIIRSICKLLGGDPPSFQAIDKIKLQLFPGTSVLSQVKEIKASTYNVITDEGEDSNTEHGEDSNTEHNALRPFEDMGIGTEELDEDEDF